jgi:Membrane proteins related to metalloendopeptidases
VTSLAQVFNPRSLKAGQDVTLVFGPPDGGARAELLALKIEPEVGLELGLEKSRDGFAALEVRHELKSETVRLEGEIESNLFAAAEKAGLPNPVFTEFIRALSYDVDFQRDVQPGDGFQILFERKVDDKGAAAEAGAVLFAEMTLSGDTIQLYRHTPKDGAADYFNAKGESAQKALMRTPVDGARLSSGFGKRRHPILGYNRMHKGVDFAAPKGTPILAAGDGVIRSAGRNRGYGNYVEIRHDSEFRTAYAHLSRFAKGIKHGTRVKQGQVIGFVGSTGLATGSHLHFEVIHKGAKVNPLVVHLPAGHKLKGAELDEFLVAKAKVDTLLAQIPAETKLASSQ